MPRTQQLTNFPDPSSQSLNSRPVDKDLPPSPPKSAAVETVTQAQLQKRMLQGGQGASSGALMEIVDLPAPHSGHIRVVQINRPSSCNAISYTLLSALRKEIQAIQSQYSQFTGAEMPWTEDDIKGPTRCLIIASSVDQSFSAGADLKELREFTPEQTSAFLIAMRDTLKALSNLPIPTISAIGSCALGSGFELALATNFRIMSSNAWVSLPETGLGIIPAAGGTHRLTALVGISRAREIILTGRRVQGPEAQALGIANRLVDVDSEVRTDGLTVLAVARRKVLVEAIRLSEEICEGAPVAVRAVLQALKDPGEKSEYAMCERVVGSEDWTEALAAFNEKRNPIFKGR
ncbi:hypothetical protein SLS53_005350 [Cytospora paraplurivora]|uniref:Enoyl-CoA hydratase n=1 Tax=Cytospora paraplurivora TaxID=2898453 RepID=A0AAN9U7H6_9PEZI